MSQSADVVIIGAGHNGLVAAILLARAGLQVTVVEEKNVTGGAARTETPFARAPELGTSTGAYLLGPMPPELLAKLDIELPLLRRDPHSFLVSTDGRYLLTGSDPEENKRQYLTFFSEKDWNAYQALEREIDALREDVAPSWLEEPLSIEDTAERYVRAELRQVFVDLCKKPVRDYLDRFDFKSDLVKAKYAITDGFPGLCGGYDTPGSGMNFLVHNMCRLPGSDGTWMIVKGGMGTVTSTMARAASAAGADIRLGAAVARIDVDGNTARRVILADGTELGADVIVVNADPFRMRDLVERERWPEEYNQRIDNYLRDGTSLKVNLCLADLPRFSCLPEDRGQYGPTIHLLPEESEVLRLIDEAWTAAQAGRLPEFPAIEWYIHTAVDPSLRDKDGRHNAALFVQWVPYELADSTWEAEEARYVQHLLSICDRYAPGTSDLVVDSFTLTPPGIERHFGITRGHIQHVDNSFGFADRLPYATPIQGLYSCSSGCHPGGSVIGCAGHNAAMRVLADLGRAAPA